MTRFPLQNNRDILSGLSQAIVVMVRKALLNAPSQEETVACLREHLPSKNIWLFLRLHRCVLK